MLQLIDFGLSKHLDSVATLGVGTPDYLAPEMMPAEVRQQVSDEGLGRGRGLGTGWDCRQGNTADSLPLVHCSISCDGTTGLNTSP